MKLIKKICIFSLLLVALITSIGIRIYASPNQVYLGGDNIGIKLNTGILVMGKYEVETTSGKIAPWKNSNIEIDDQIISIDNYSLTDNFSLLSALKKIDKEEVQVKIKRNDQIITTTIKIALSKNNQKSLGLYIKDKVLGIGTLTFIVPESNTFASLGHGIYHDHELYQTSSGMILTSNVTDVKKATVNDAGELRATIGNQVIGYTLKNTNTGLYGIAGKKLTSNRKLIPIATIEEIKPGKASIYTTINNNQIKEFQIEIIDKSDQKTKDIKGIKLKITDPNLINITGGIVQGMSGSPIVQNGKIIGAVSHVTIENPTIGYGMYACWMLEDAKK